MKKLLLLIAIFSFINSTAQDLAHLRSMNKTEASEFAYNIVTDVREELMLWDVQETNDLLTFEFIEASTDTVALNKVIKSGHHIDVQFYEIDFEVFYEGQDKTLEIEGEKKYRFYQARLKFLDMFPVWKKYFDNTATITGVREEFKYTAKGNDGYWNYKFKSTAKEPYWLISKFY